MQTKRFLLIWLGFVTAVPAQNYFPKKDAAFGQVVVGGGYETIINVTNRGTHPYEGKLGLFRTVNEASVAWNPTVNGDTVVDGEYPVVVQPAETVTLRLTGTQLEAGAAILLSDNLLLDNLIEANLTYLILDAGQVSDSVGIAPSKEFYRAAIPFEEFRETALALVNGDLTRERTASIELNLFSSDGDPVGSTRVIRLGSLAHTARFMNELFPGQTLQRGKVEIVSDSPIFGTALTFSSGQFSSLPLDPAPVTYSVRLETSDEYATGELALWADGSFIRGYMVISGVGERVFEEPEFSLVNGELEDGYLRLAFTILQDPFFGEEVTISLGTDNFSFDSNLVEGKWIQLFHNDEILVGNYLLESTALSRTNGEPARIWSKSGTGADVFSKPCGVSKVRIQGTYNGPESSQNFIVYFEGDSGSELVVNEILGTAEGYSKTYSGTHRAEGCGDLVIERATGVSWKFTEVL